MFADALQAVQSPQSTKRLPTSRAKFKRRPWGRSRNEYGLTRSALASDYGARKRIEGNQRRSSFRATPRERWYCCFGRVALLFFHEDAVNQSVRPALCRNQQGCRGSQGCKVRDCPRAIGSGRIQGAVALESDGRPRHRGRGWAYGFVLE